jgi:hypothetical protein
MTTTLEEIKELLIILQKNVEKNNEKLDMISKKMDGEIMEECKKMSSHIDFVEAVYENMKNPINYICGVINSDSNVKTICNDKMET